MFWICAENSVGNTGMFLIIAQQCLHRFKAFSALTPPAIRLGGHKKLGGDTARTAGPNRPKGYSIPYDIMLSI